MSIVIMPNNPMTPNTRHRMHEGAADYTAMPDCIRKPVQLTDDEAIKRSSNLRIGYKSRISVDRAGDMIINTHNTEVFAQAWQDEMDARVLAAVVKIRSDHAPKDKARATVECVAGLVREVAMREVFGNGRLILNNGDHTFWLYSAGHWAHCGKMFVTRMVLPLCSAIISRFDEPCYGIAAATLVVRWISRAVDDLSKEMRFTPSTNPAPILNLTNGEVHINTVIGSHELKPHCPESYQTHVLPYEYDPDAKCPLFLQTLSAIFEPTGKYLPDVIRHMAEVFGYLIQPNKTPGHWFFLYGAGGNGKTLLTHVLRGLIGNKLTLQTTEILNRTRNNKMLAGKTVVLINPVGDNTILSTDSLRKLSSPSKNHTLEYTGSLVIESNHTLKTDSGIGAIAHTANVIPFSVNFCKTGKAIIGLHDTIIANELPGVLNWALAGYARFASRGHSFLTPEPFAKATHDQLQHST